MADEYWRECDGCPFKGKEDHPECSKSFSAEARAKRTGSEAGCWTLKRPAPPGYAQVVQDARERLRAGHSTQDVRAWLTAQYLELMRDEVLRRRHVHGEPPPRETAEGKRVDGSALIEMMAGKAARGVVFALSRCPTPHVKCDHCRSPRCAKERMDDDEATAEAA